MKDDTISRQAAIEAMRKAKDKSEAHRMLMQLPSAQLDVPDTNIGDMISRQAALDALDKVAEMFPYRIPGKAKTYRQYNEAWSDAIDAAENALEALPSAQPDTCDGCKWEGAFGYGECQHCKRAFDDMFEEGESV